MIKPVQQQPLFNLRAISVKRKVKVEGILPPRVVMGLL